MRDALERLFGTKAPTTIIAVVQKRLSSGRYQVQDESDRYYVVDSEKEWKRGSRVIVQAGRIVDSAGRYTQIRTFYV